MYKKSELSLNFSSGCRIVDLRSDGVSQPTERMRVAMANAVVGDDVLNDDPTVQALEEKCANLFGKEAALFVPSGVMGNLIAIMVHCRERGSEVMLGHSTHTYLYEQGEAASITGVSLNPLPNNSDGTFSLNEFRAKIRGSDPLHEPKTKLVIVENTHNLCGGRVIPLEWMDELAAICKKRKIKMHMDGARVFHAAEYLDMPVSRIARDFDSVVFNLCKALCAPIGSVLIGSNDFIKRARRTRMALGGGMCKIGIVAAAGLVALEDVVPKLGCDHRHARQIAKAIHDLHSPYVTVDIDAIETNIGLIHFLQPKKYPAKYFVERLQQINNKELSAGITDKFGNGIIVNVFAKDERTSIRYVTYYHINDELTELIIKKIVYCIKEFE